MPVETDFDLREVGEPGGEGILCETRFISVDPYLRGRLSGRHISGPIQPGEPMESELILRTLEPAPGLVEGSLVRAFGPWQNRSRLPAEGLVPVPDTVSPPSLALGVLGMPGLTAYAGVRRYLRPEAGQTLVVSAAAGPVGATAGQLGRLAGARVVGIAGSEEKCRWLREAARFDATIDYRTEDLRDGLERNCPNGVDMYFDNVGGEMLNAVMTRLARQARVVLCGLMAQYNTDEPPPGPNPGLVIRARASLHGLVVYDHEDLRDEMIDELTPLVTDGDIACREFVSRGIESAAAAFCTLMRGENFGKTIVAL